MDGPPSLFWIHAADPTTNEMKCLAVTIVKIRSLTWLWSGNFHWRGCYDGTWERSTQGVVCLILNGDVAKVGWRIGKLDLSDKGLLMSQENT